MTGADARALEALAAAESGADVLAEVAGWFGGPTPAPEQLAGDWWSELPGPVQIEVSERLRRLSGGVVSAGLSEPPTDEPPGYGGALFVWWEWLWSGTPGKWATPDVAAHVLTRAWLALYEADPDECPGHPLASLVEAWIEAHPKDATSRHLIVTEERKPPPKEDPLILNRAPGLLALAGLCWEAVEVDGEPFATREPGGLKEPCAGGRKRRRYRLADTPAQGELWPGPRTLHKHATGGVVLDSLADLHLTGDERSSLRNDMAQIGRFGYALTGSARVDMERGAVLVGGRDTPANRKRFRLAALAMDGLYLIFPGWDWWDLLDASRIDDTAFRIGPPEWWRRQSGPVSYRLSGGLFRPLAFPNDRTPWRNVAIARTIDGIEAALLWGTFAAPRKRKGKRKAKRFDPDAVRPVRPGGPGPEYFIPWWKVLQLSGENVGPDANPKGRDGDRYRRRAAMLREAEYFTARDGTAPLGDTIEVVEQVDGRGRGRQAGIMVRASARYCAAYQTGKNGGGKETRLPSSRLLTPPG